MIYQDILLSLFGLVGLYFGAEWLVSGSSRLALRLGVSPLIVGLTVVAFGTSSPELLFCLNANMGNGNGGGDLVIGNVIGSNICNIALILGVAALIRPLGIKRQLVLRELPILVVITGILAYFLMNGVLTRLEGGLLMSGLLMFLLMSAITTAREIRESVLAQAVAESEGAPTLDKVPVFRCLTLVVVGLAALMLGADALVGGAKAIAHYFHVPDAIIALTLVAIGTSLPELATSIAASLKGQGDIATGNVVGSNIFNILAILGITAVVKPVVFNQISNVDLGFMVGLSALLLPLLWFRRSLGRMEGGLLLLLFVGYGFLLYQRIQAGQVLV